MSSWGDFSKLADSGMLAQFGDDHPTTLASSLHILLLLLLLAAQRRRAYYLHLSPYNSLWIASTVTMRYSRGARTAHALLAAAMPILMPWEHFLLCSPLQFSCHPSLARGPPMVPSILPCLPPSLIAFLRPLLSSHTLTRCALLSTAKCHIPSQTPLTARPRQTWLHMHACIPVYIYIYICAASVSPMYDAR